MGLLTSNDFPSLQALYTAQLRYLLSTENQILKGLSDMIEHADDVQLRQAFQSHLQETEVHVSRLKQLIGDIDDDVDDKKDPILTAIAGSAKNITKESDSGPVRDAGLIATAQKIEHYQIASYGSARDWATHLGLTDHAATLQATLEEEKHADLVLSQISQLPIETLRPSRLRTCRQSVRSNYIDSSILGGVGREAGHAGLPPLACLQMFSGGWRNALPQPFRAAIST
jgi:ferritin-like metal-binding protein YciE